MLIVPIRVLCANSFKACARMGHPSFEGLIRVTHLCPRHAFWETAGWGPVVFFWSSRAEYAQNTSVLNFPSLLLSL